MVIDNNFALAGGQSLQTSDILREYPLPRNGIGRFDGPTWTGARAVPPVRLRSSISSSPGCDTTYLSKPPRPRMPTCWSWLDLPRLKAGVIDDRHLSRADTTQRYSVPADERKSVCNRFALCNQPNATAAMTDDTPLPFNLPCRPQETHNRFQRQDPVFGRRAVAAARSGAQAWCVRTTYGGDA